MPVYYSHSRHLPLTPPDAYDTYSYVGKSQPQAVHPSYDQYQYNTAMVMNEPYYPPTHAERHGRYEDALMLQERTTVSAASRGNVYGPIAAPVLPPIRVPEQHVSAPQDHRREVALQPQETKQEKSAGGVAAQLDYEMEPMVDFVAQMTSGMWRPFVERHDLSGVDFARHIQPSSIAVDKKFRQYVHSVLTSTRLPSATLLLALHYLSDRIKRRSARGDFPHRASNNLYHLLTVALMLASKFLDDNTFQNRSWAEVSQLPVNELNAREMDWLHDIRWALHVDWEDATGVRAWFAKWDDCSKPRVQYSSDLNLDRLKLNPIDVGLRNLAPSAPVSPPNRDLPSFSASYQPYEHVRLPAPAEIQWPQIRSLSPPSAGPTQSSTPEYYTSASVTPCYMNSQQPFSQQPAFGDYGCRNGPKIGDDQLVYTKFSPVYGPGYVCQTRQNGGYTYDTHSFVGLDYTKRYAAQLELGWCELHHRFNCLPCSGYNHAMYGQVAAA